MNTIKSEFTPEEFRLNTTDKSQISLCEINQSYAFESCLLKSISGNNQNSGKTRKAVGTHFQECLTTEAYVKKMKRKNEKKEKKKEKHWKKRDKLSLKKDKKKKQNKLQ